MLPNPWIVIPAYNEEPALASVLTDLLRQYSQVVVVDDGSTDGTSRVAAQFPVYRLRHRINLGQGAALRTGLDFALRQQAEILVSFDADGQMLVDDIERVCQPIRNGSADVALGTRWGNIPPDMPWTRQLLLKAALRFTQMTSGLPISDTHNGFRAFNAAAAKRIAITQNGMAHASQIISEIARQQIRFTEVPVRISYSAYSSKKGQKSLNSLNILWDLFFGQ